MGLNPHSLSRGPMPRVSPPAPELRPVSCSVPATRRADFPGPSSRLPQREASGTHSTGRPGRPEYRASGSRSAKLVVPPEQSCGIVTIMSGR